MTVKSKLFLVVTGVALSLLSSARSHAAEILVNAINSGKVRATFRGRGSSSGDSMIVTVAKTNRAGRGPLVLSVPAGTRLNSASASVQNMVIAGVRGRMIDSHRFQPATEIELASTAPVSFLLEAYCAEFEKDNPSSSSGFSAGGWDKTLAAVLKEAKRRGLSPAATQAAVWIVTDDISLDALQEKFSVSQAEWNQARAVVERTRKGASSRAMFLRDRPVVMASSLEPSIRPHLGRPPAPFDQDGNATGLFVSAIGQEASVYMTPRRSN